MQLRLLYLERQAEHTVQANRFAVVFPKMGSQLMWSWSFGIEENVII